MSKTSARDIEKHWEKTVRDFGKECLMEHNRLRSIHTSPPLKLSKDLCRTAQKHARQLVNEQSVMRLPEINFGQNVASIKTSMNNALSGIDESVLNEYLAISTEPNLTNTNEIMGSGCSMLVQGIGELRLFRGESRERRSFYTTCFGVTPQNCFVAQRSQDRELYIVAHYSPTGNVDGRFVTNVMKPEVCK
ncbi:hypothetical protein FGIG_09765 [Fasciola gigantica]|uniref:SCP domain-containing protein n=1 Tax=Fasciola gigantica TaxID=46835 RepID=A0A504YAK1_FASGI|nr:hypothetical protein FGIG_09765 [Fasciola gigantica]